MPKYYINPTKQTLHGSFSQSLEPVLTIHSGDSVQYKTLDALWGLEAFQPSGERQVSSFRNKNSGHALAGPIKIIGAEPGMTLAITINKLKTGNWGFSFAGGNQAYKEMLGIPKKDNYQLNWHLDRENMIGYSNENHQVDLSPFMGAIGMPPAEDGIHSTVPPRFCGGNIDCKELVEGSILYLPISVSGGLVSVGDGHALQGDGEVSTQAIECPMEIVDLTFTLKEEMRLQMPRAYTPKGWITFGFDESLDDASMIAMNGMLDLMVEEFNMTRMEAYTLASLVVDLRITQVVNRVKGVHALLPHHALRKSEEAGLT